jgi:hypothetical protein
MEHRSDGPRLRDAVLIVIPNDDLLKLPERGSAEPWYRAAVSLAKLMLSNPGRLAFVKSHLDAAIVVFEVPREDEERVWPEALRIAKARASRA